MTTFRFERFCMLLLLASCCTVPAAAQQERHGPESCGDIDPSVERACIARRVADKERRLAKLYPKALAKVSDGFRRYGRDDNRTDPKYLEQSQAHWMLFVDNDCTVQAAFGGGSNSSISDRLSDCYEQALDKRLEFLGQLTEGSFGTE